ncbi:cytochrome aa3 quinol oxidase subunit III [Paenibacillus dendritiformis]|jgi:cytochrome aa3-600 menaquinol oxidase subunit III|uniref:Quinol oxidase subunit 3 n=2 Tax=Paenibacillus TaxID=44249 RepID=H3SND6_9BACL|nr:MULTISPECIES: cytochrome aa3 quinol oxidase subunit III [Paenibacillus]EHQ59419.1 cytochrome aa3 quinol oxidase subunit III [Paenibacillus dendritiformis C454]PZM63048.1 cytochrome aa3 quinol oxidase subunit III [Paenibacillus dendritiformis]RJG23809.1 cytochrome aa3 quinol oxidase subunit III [Paenibacillus thiaminolyticus]TDL48570.1 cytochrome aa3 quinol oxidase subunit III [Paenibacillus dendritiformis]WGU93452.1 cytochrome aa3 quinol oxidase subunit III [Paenibacillus dendritiformis]
MKLDNTLPLEYRSEENSNRIFGFWLFLGAEIVLFSTLFAVYLTLWNRTGSGPTGTDIFELKGVLIETFLLLTSSFTCGLAIHSMRLGLKKPSLVFFGITLLLGLGFLGVEIAEFVTYVHEGATLQTSAFLSSLFVLLGTHGAHVTLGLLWGAGIMIQISREGFTLDTSNKSFIFSLYWHFLDVVWIFIFSFVYLKGLM